MEWGLGMRDTWPCVEKVDTPAEEKEGAVYRGSLASVDVPRP